MKEDVILLPILDDKSKALAIIKKLYGTGIH